VLHLSEGPTFAILVRMSLKAQSQSQLTSLRTPSENNSNQLCLIFALTALILYVPANLYPFMTISLYGKTNSSTIWSGVVSLANDGSWAIAIVVFLASVLIPFLKLLILFYLSLTSPQNQSALKLYLYNLVEAIGRWSMLDIFLLAVLVAIMKLGRWTEVKPELGSLLFLFVVIFTILASANFNPSVFQKEESHAND
jgi:paraquat-inducible protein A